MSASPPRSNNKVAARDPPKNKEAKTFDFFKRTPPKPTPTTSSKPTPTTSSKTNPTFVSPTPTTFSKQKPPPPASLKRKPTSTQHKPTNSKKPNSKPKKAKTLSETATSDSNASLKRKPTSAPDNPTNSKPKKAKTSSATSDSNAKKAEWTPELVETSSDSNAETDSNAEMMEDDDDDEESKTKSVPQPKTTTKKKKAKATSSDNDEWMPETVVEDDDETAIPPDNGLEEHDEWMDDDGNPMVPEALKGHKQHIMKIGGEKKARKIAKPFCLEAADIIMDHNFFEDPLGHYKSQFKCHPTPVKNRVIYAIMSKDGNTMWKTGGHELSSKIMTVQSFLGLANKDAHSDTINFAANPNAKTRDEVFSTKECTDKHKEDGREDCSSIIRELLGSLFGILHLDANRLTFDDDAASGHKSVHDYGIPRV